ncbi:MAG TPA: LemA family protein [Rudaea sp.]|nr:LemA family protein [Rudaea sp.]
MWLFLVLLIVAVGIGWIFNRLVRDRNQVHAAWSDVDVQLQRRHDLVPALVESVRAYARHETELFARVATERSRARATPGIAARGTAEKSLGLDLSRLIALGEAYPELKASSSFSQLSTQLVQVEDDLQHARRFYNGSVRDYNTHLQRFPDLLIAGAFGFRAAEFFSAGDDAAAAPGVTLA